MERPFRADDGGDGDHDGDHDGDDDVTDDNDAIVDDDDDDIDDDDRSGQLVTVIVSSWQFLVWAHPGSSWASQ